MEKTLKEVVDAILEQTAVFKTECAKLTNKSAAKRSRVASLALEKLFKEYRKLSIK